MIDPYVVHALEQDWAQINAILDEILSALLVDVPILNEATGLSDGSVVFQHMHEFVQIQRQICSENVLMTERLCAAALTRLALGGREVDVNELEKGMNT